MKYSGQMPMALVALAAFSGILLSSPAAPGAQGLAAHTAEVGAEPAPAEEAEEPRYYREPEAGAMIIDGLVVRPVSLVATIIGGAVYVVTLPFSALGGNAGEAGEQLFLNPAEYTFTRCLGCFNEWR